MLEDGRARRVVGGGGFFFHSFSTLCFTLLFHLVSRCAKDYVFPLLLSVCLSVIMVCIKKGRQTPIPVPDTVSSLHERSMCVCVCVFCVSYAKTVYDTAVPSSFVFFPIGISRHRWYLCVVCLRGLHADETKTNCPISRSRSLSLSLISTGALKFGILQSRDKEMTRWMMNTVRLVMNI